MGRAICAIGAICRPKPTLTHTKHEACMLFVRLVPLAHSPSKDVLSVRLV